MGRAIDRAASSPVYFFAPIFLPYQFLPRQQVDFVESLRCRGRRSVGVAEEELQGAGGSHRFWVIVQGDSGGYPSTLWDENLGWV
jgi:hypothetical protein